LITENQERNGLVITVLILKISVEQTLTEFYHTPGKVPGAEDTKIIKKRSLPLRISQSNGKANI
jgi:hypothetical protein